ncbi:MAG: hypothetical protein K0R63_1472 [Rickettsiales bacterium]|jgi:uncharacterized Zn-finger protein|nr:hypothetical protein [Rickettsiales bacterium]
MEPFEIVYTDKSEVHCGGAGGSLGHPVVYLELAPKGEVTCPYCSRKFILVASSETTAAHT